jgi:hypothetical protein
LPSLWAAKFNPIKIMAVLCVYIFPLKGEMGLVAADGSISPFLSPIRAIDPEKP